VHVFENCSAAFRKGLRFGSIAFVSNIIGRASEYYGRHGLRNTAARAVIGFKRALFANRMAVFSCGLENLDAVPITLPVSVFITGVTTYTELADTDLQAIIGFWNPKEARRNLTKRFNKRACLWLLKSADVLAGYGWTLEGTTIEPYFFPLAQDDVHLFDFHVFPEYRGRGFNQLLVNYILADLTARKKRRAFIEAAEWNVAQLSSLRKTPFRQIAWARKSIILRRQIVSWQ
jgi:ribosomal protein S18 acetylase RimI-like enzyme